MHTQPEEEIKINEGNNVDELYYFSSFFAFDLEIRNGNNVTMENQRLVRWMRKVTLGVLMKKLDGNLMVSRSHGKLNHRRTGVWIDTSTYSSPIFGMYQNH